MTRADIKLLLLYLVLTGSILFRVVMEKSGYLSPDSDYYLQIAQNLVSGKGFIMTDPRAENTAEASQIAVTLWPIGYPGLIATVSVLTSLSVFWASKVLNLVFLAGCFFLLRVISKERACLLGLIFCSFSLLEIFTYTWSEVPFLFFLLLFSVALQRCADNFHTASVGWWAMLFLGSAGLFLSRYIGLFSVLVLGLAALYFLLKKEPRKALNFFGIGFLSGCIIVGYFFRNYLLDGSISGDEREFEKEETILHFIWIFTRGLLNELTIIRHNYFEAGPDSLFWITAAVQLIWMGWVYIKSLRNKVILRLGETTDFRTIFLCVAAVYFVVLVVLRFAVPFNSIDFRFLSTVTLLCYSALILMVIQPENSAVAKPLERHLALFFLFSLLVNVAKLTYLQDLLR